MITSFLYKYSHNKAFFLSFLIIGLFVICPEYDILLSSLLFIRNLDFIFKGTIENINYFIMILTCLLLCCIVCYNLFKSFKTRNKECMKNMLYTFFIVFIVHILIVNIIIKDNMFGRARPLNIKSFGGDKNFTRAFEISDQCNTNCSFVSGDVSFSFAAFGVCLAIPIGNFITKKRKKIILDIALLSGFMIFLFRIVVGKHFFTDVFCAMVLVIISSFFMYRCVFGKTEYNNLHEFLLS